MAIVGLIVAILAFVSLVRMMFFLIGSEFYGRWTNRLVASAAEADEPLILILSPAYNEEKTILRCLESVRTLDYPSEKVFHLIVDDGSTDSTASVVQEFLETYGSEHPLEMLRVPNGGKAHALNAGFRLVDSVPGMDDVDLVMCLDSDSAVEPGALKAAVRYFSNPKVRCLASHVKIIPERSLLNFVQRFEYLMCYRMKRAQAVFQTDYIVGGIGSMFRRSAFRDVGYYDTNTVTEDIDASMKLLAVHGNRENVCVYAADVIAHTESCPNMSSLIRQRYRWKWGRCQTFLKRRSVFFSADHRFTRFLSWFYLPMEIVFDLLFLLEPVLIGYLLYLAVAYLDVITLVSAVATVSLYMIVNVWREPYYRGRDRLLFAVSAPLLYLLNYALSFAEYVALIRALIGLPVLRNSLISTNRTWKSPDRTGAVVS